MYLPNPVNVAYTGFGGWYVTVKVDHAYLCKNIDCDKAGWYTIYVEPWRTFS